MCLVAVVSSIALIVLVVLIDLIDSLDEWREKLLAELLAELPEELLAKETGLFVLAAQYALDVFDAFESEAFFVFFVFVVFFATVTTPRSTRLAQSRDYNFVEAAFCVFSKICIFVCLFQLFCFNK